MHFSKLDTRMRVYEEALDVCVLPNLWMVARLDGKGFSKLTQREEFNKPFDDRFKSLMSSVTEYLMTETGFKFIYAYTESDEISLLFSIDENTFNRKLRKLNSTLAGLASAKFTMESGIIGSFDCRISQLPSIDLVEDYFSWRQEDAHRNALNGYCYWTLRQHNISARQATSMLNGKGTYFKNELLFNYGINYNDTALWHRRGIGMYTKPTLINAVNKKTGDAVTVTRNKLYIDEQLSYQEDYRNFIGDLCRSNQN